MMRSGGGTNRHYPPAGDRPARHRALPRRLRRLRVLVVGCGDVGMRLVAHLRRTHAAIGIVALTRDPARRQTLRELGATPLALDLDDRRAVRRLAGLGDWVTHLAPPPSVGVDDPRTGRLIAALLRPGHRPPRRFAYVSTTGVYGDCAGARFDETRPPAPASARARRRVAAESRLRRAALRGLTILRAPGIYDSGPRLPVERLRRGTPALAPGDDVYTNHVHADDLAATCVAAWRRGRPRRVYHAVDDSELKMGDYFDRVADALGLPRPPRLERASIVARVSPALLSFMSESRRLANHRLKQELRVRLAYPTVDTALRDAAALVESPASPE